MVTIIGAGLAGSEAAWQLAERGVSVRLYEMRPHKRSPAHQTGHCAELVCSNSLRSDDADNNAVGLLHAEMRLLNSLVMKAADRFRVPAGGALAVDREAFSIWIDEQLENHPNITLLREELHRPPAEGLTVIASGPLTSEPLARWLEGTVGPRLSFFDAIAPIVSRESIDMEKAWMQSRYDKGGADYINCPLDRDQYETLVAALSAGERVAEKSFENIPHFEGCLPVEVMARRGPETLRHGPLKPVGLTNPHQPDVKPWAVVQLRRDNRLGTLWNMVGFQTKLTWPEQKKIFRTIPGLEAAEFPRLGAVHRNTFINGPALLDGHLRLKGHDNLFFAGQITGVEGYVESAASGLTAGLFLTVLVNRGTLPEPPPPTTAHGALLAHVTQGAEVKTFQPMNVNFGLFPPLQQRVTKREKKPAISRRALFDLQQWLKNQYTS